MMELTYQSAMVLPAAYAVLSEDEMTYIEGGVSEMQAAVLNFGINLVVNSVRMLGRGALNSAMTGLKEMHDDGMGLTTSVQYFWDGQNTVVSIYKQMKEIYQQSKADKAAEQAAAAAIPNTTLAVA